MSAKQKPGGVAGRVIVRLRNSRAKTSAKSHELAGAYEMRDELSREARAILAAWDDHIERELDGGGVAGEWMTDGWPIREAMQKSFTRLGLKLESEDGGA